MKDKEIKFDPTFKIIEEDKFHGSSFSKYGLPIIEYREFDLERLRLTIKELISKREDWKNLDFIMREIEDKIELLFIRNLAVLKQDKQIYFEFPKTWKDYFKLKYRDHWFIKRWIKKHPIQFSKHKYEIDKMVVFPNFEIPKGDSFTNHFIIKQVYQKELFKNE